MLCDNEVFSYLTMALIIGHVRLSRDQSDTITINVPLNMTEAELVCNSTVAVAWLRENDVLAEGGMLVTMDKRIEISITREVKKLSIKDIMSNYSGNYSCVEYKMGVVTNYTIIKYNVVVTVKLTMGDVASNISVLEGDDARMSCPVNGRPAPSIKWYMVGGNKPTDIIDIGINGKILVIKNFTRQCAVTYMCIAKSNYSDPVNLTMTPTPLFSPEVEASTTNENASKTSDVLHIPSRLYKPVKLMCKIEASPFHNITWARDGLWLAIVRIKKGDMTVIKHNENDNITGLYDHTFKLKRMNKSNTYFASVEFPLIYYNMFAKYTCITVNSYGRDEKNFNITKV